jgi:hypothetical protein
MRNFPTQGNPDLPGMKDFALFICLCRSSSDMFFIISYCDLICSGVILLSMLGLNIFIYY